MLCGVCGQEVRFDWRSPDPQAPDVGRGYNGWAHREPADHRGVPVLEGEPVEEPEPIPPPEVPKHEVDPDEFGNRSGIKIVINALRRSKSWEFLGVWHARGPYLGSKGTVLSISDRHVVKGREVDTGRIVVGTWRDGKFDTGYIGTIVDGSLNPFPANSDDLRAWIKGDLPDPLQQPREQP